MTQKPLNIQDIKNTLIAECIHKGYGVQLSAILDNTDFINILETSLRQAMGKVVYDTVDEILENLNNGEKKSSVEIIETNITNFFNKKI